MKLVDVKDNAYIESSKEVNDNDWKFKVGEHVRNQNPKTFLSNDRLQIGLKKFLWIKTLKMQFYGHMLLMISMVEKENYKKQINEDLG